MYNKIYDFCKVRNLGNVHRNSSDKPTPRLKFIISLLESEGIEYILDKSKSYTTTIYNLILKGDSDKMVVAHHDVSNSYIDNANDNSCSVINAIMVKKLLPNINVVLLDGEECGGLGSQRLAKQINDGFFGEIEWVLNLELTGRGGRYFFIGDYPGKLQSHIKSLFDCPIVQTPYNDSETLRRFGIDSCVINPLPPLQNDEISEVLYEGKYLDMSMLENCHTQRDTIDTISVDDMKEFVETILIKILS